MTWRTDVNDHCATLPGAEHSDPWGGGHDAWKVGGKLFAIQGAMAEGVSVKCADVETAEMLRDIGGCEKAPYLHRSWVRVPEATPMEKTRDRIDSSYDIIRSALPRRLQSALPERSA